MQMAAQERSFEDRRSPPNHASIPFPLPFPSTSFRPPRVSQAYENGRQPPGAASFYNKPRTPLPSLTSGCRAPLIFLRRRMHKRDLCFTFAAAWARNGIRAQRNFPACRRLSICNECGGGWKCRFSNVQSRFPWRVSRIGTGWTSV